MPHAPSSRPPLDTGKAHPARVYDWLLGGKDHYQVDAAVGERLPAEGRHTARLNREFMHRAADWAARQGIGQFLDIGTGIPTEPNLHQVVQRVDPAARIVYVDNDPIVLRHAQALLVSTPEGVTDYVDGDVRDPASILRRAGAVLDLGRPVVLSLVSLLHFIPDEEDPYGITRTLLDALAPGSLLILAHGTWDFHPELADRAVNAYRESGITLRFRTRAEVARFFEGLVMEPPGLVTGPEWYRDTPPPEFERNGVYVGVGRVP